MLFKILIIIFAVENNNNKKVVIMKYQYYSLKDAYCSFDVSLMLRKAGFVEDCHAAYSMRSKEHELHLNTLSNNGSVHQLACPTHQMALDWMRMKYNIHIYVIPSGNHWEAEIYSFNNDSNNTMSMTHIDHAYGDTDRIAIESALKCTLEKLKDIELNYDS